jgi:hypothetical protein
MYLGLGTRYRQAAVPEDGYRVSSSEWFVDGYSLDSTTVDRVLRFVNRFSSIAIFGFTSMLEFVAKEVIRRGSQPAEGKVRAAWNGGEMLFETQSTVFREAFGLPILNFYGGRELSAMAYQAPRAQTLTVLRPFMFLEILDEAGKPVSDREALAKADRAKKFVLFLKHQPHPDPDAIGMYDLMLSGHTHNGQIWPFTYLVRPAHPLIAGRHDVGKGSIVYTSRGSGTWGPPIRFLAPPEIPVIELVRKAP